jgi:hypothetical protein
MLFQPEKAGYWKGRSASVGLNADRENAERSNFLTFVRDRTPVID